MLVIACVLLAAAAVPLTGGRLSLLAGLRLRGVLLVVAALLAQVVVVEVPGLPVGPSAVVHVLTYVLAGAFLWLNRGVPGLWLLALGTASNGVVIALNGGELPSSAAARLAAGVVPGPGFVNSGPVAHPVLGWLGDVFAWPAPLPLANTFSAGDVLVVAGATWLLHASTRPARARSGGAGPEALGRAADGRPRPLAAVPAGADGLVGGRPSPPLVEGKEPR